MTKLQLLLIIVSIAFLILSFRVYKRKKIWLPTFALFFFWSCIVGIFALRIEWLNAIGITFGLNRGADLIVYVSIILLFYFVLELYNKNTKLHLAQTELIRSLSLERVERGPVQDAEIAFIIPAYNESVHCIQVIQEVLDTWNIVVFIDDGSQNWLFKLLKQHFQETKNLVLIHHIRNLGQGAALQTGFDYVQQELPQVQFVVTFDSDGQHLLSDLKNFRSAFENNADLEIALGSRFLGSTVNMPRSKKLVLKIWILFTSFFSGILLTDTHNGYRMIKAAALPKFRITFNGMEHASEIIDIIAQNKIVYQEVPNTIVYTEYSLSRGQKISNSIKIVKNLIFNKFFWR